MARNIKAGAANGGNNRNKERGNKMAKGEQEETSLTIKSGNRPAFLEGAKVDSLGIGQEDIILPRIQLISSQSDIRKKHTNCESDQFWHTGEEYSIGKEFPFIVITFKKSLVLMRPQGDKNEHLPKVLATSDDLINWNRAGTWEVYPDKHRSDKAFIWEITDSRKVAASGLADWGSAIPDVENSPPAATLSYQYLVLPVGVNEEKEIDYNMLGPSIFTISRTSIKYAKKLNSRLQRFAAQSTPATGVVFLGKVEVESNKEYTYNVWGFEAQRYASEDEYRKAEALREMSDRVSNEIQEDDVFETFSELGPEATQGPELDDKIPF